MCVLKGFEPIIGSDPKIMILGSMPSVKSLQQVEYYAHKSNRFWLIMQAIYQMPIDDYKQKQAIILHNHLLLWDVIAYCHRKGSLDSNIKDVVVNDIESLIKQYPSIQLIICNGKKSYELYQKHFKHLPLPCICLPSTSSANRSIKETTLFDIWEKHLKNISE